MSSIFKHADYLGLTVLIRPLKMNAVTVLLEYLISCVHVIHIPFLMDWLVVQDMLTILFTMVSMWASSRDRNFRLFQLKPTPSSDQTPQSVVF